MVTMRTICFDLDGVLCNQTAGDYENACPNREAIGTLNKLYADGYRIIIFTSRFMNRNNGDMIEAYKDGYEFTQQQLAAWGVKYHDLYMGKPAYDVLIDDRSVFFNQDWDTVMKKLRATNPETS